MILHHFLVKSYGTLTVSQRFLTFSYIPAGNTCDRVQSKSMSIALTQGRRSGWNDEGDAWRAPKVGRCRMGWGIVTVSPLQPTRRSGGAS